MSPGSKKRLKEGFPLQALMGMELVSPIPFLAHQCPRSTGERSLVEASASQELAVCEDESPGGHTMTGSAYARPVEEALQLSVHANQWSSDQLVVTEGAQLVQHDLEKKSTCQNQSPHMLPNDLRAQWLGQLMN